MTDEKTSEDHQRKARRCCGLTLKDGLNFLSSLILPSMLGVFTVIITFQQQKLAQEQRTEDLQVTRQQRLEDRNELRLQRELEWNISQAAQSAQSRAVIDQYRDQLLIAYIKEMGDMLENKNGSITSDFVSRTLARVKTLNALRQLDGTRQTHIIGFLYEAGLLTDTDQSNPLDISSAKLTDIDFSALTPLETIEGISLSGVHMNNCTFEGKQYENMNLSFTRLSNVDFSPILLEKVDFSFAILKNVTFVGSEMHFLNFYSATLRNVQFSPSNLHNSNFSFGDLCYVDFTGASIYTTIFADASSMENTNFSSTTLDHIDFSSAPFDNVDFSSANLQNVQFTSAVVRTKIDFTSADLSIGVNTFHRSKLKNAIFKNCRCNNTDFTYSNLKGSSFHRAKLGQTNFSIANLQEVDFRGTEIENHQLESALSIRNAKLPNGTLGPGRNLVRNGDANCRIPLAQDWQINNGSIAILPLPTDRNQCQFVLQSMTVGATMSQIIVWENPSDASFWGQSTVDLRGQMSDGVSIELIWRNNNGLDLATNVIDSKWNESNLHIWNLTDTLEVIVTFNPQMNELNNGNRWCDNIEILTNYDTT